MLNGAILISLLSSNPLSGWPIQLAIAAPFIMALAWFGKKMWDRLEKIEIEKKDLTDKVINEMVGTIKSATIAIDANTKALSETLDFTKDLRQELALERTIRVRLEERSRGRSEDMDDLMPLHKGREQ